MLLLHIPFMLFYMCELYAFRVVASSVHNVKYITNPCVKITCRALAWKMLLYIYSRPLCCNRFTGTRRHF